MISGTQDGRRDIYYNLHDMFKKSVKRLFPSESSGVKRKRESDSADGSEEVEKPKKMKKR